MIVVSPQKLRSLHYRKYSKSRFSGKDKGAVNTRINSTLHIVPLSVKRTVFNLNYLSHNVYFFIIL